VFTSCDARREEIYETMGWWSSSTPKQVEGLPEVPRRRADSLTGGGKCPSRQCPCRR
jgi:hypothetical protein